MDFNSGMKYIKLTYGGWKKIVFLCTIRVSIDSPKREEKAMNSVLNNKNDSKDIFKIKGGDNDHVIIGTVKLRDITNYQASYYDNLDKKLIDISNKKKNPKRRSATPKRTKPEIKKISARFDVTRAKAKNNSEHL